MENNSNILGIDIGSVSIGVAEVDPKREIVKTSYEFHHGNITENLKKILSDFDLSRICGIAATSSTPSVLNIHSRYDNRVSIIAAARHYHEKVGSILIVGGEEFGLIGFDHQGNYRSFKTNTSCAAGTGSFLDQQARRLNLRSIQELSELAFDNKGPIPKIASRCAVFAKTDLVHAQQEGYTLGQICDGLCYGLAKNIVDTLFMDKRVHSPVIFTGGVSKNRAVVYHIQSLMGKEFIVDKTGIYGAIGAAFLLADEPHKQHHRSIKSVKDILIHKPVEKRYFHDPLTLKLSHYPEFKGVERYEYEEEDHDDSVEVDIYETLKPSVKHEVYLGVDIGSTSTKAILMNKDGRVLVGTYTRTGGRPVAAVQRLFSSIQNIIDTKGIDIQILGAGTTGAGRKFAGKIIKADIIIDEITAHARAACEINPHVDTIIEIDGQDSKFTTLRNGMVTFSVMNNVCAAGTGSFIEEQAQKLDCPLRDYSNRTENQRSPIVSDRCTVFMERDINHYLGEGFSVNEVLASALHSVRENYLTKVAIEKSIGNTVLFQGATAKNRALVAAFEQRLKKPIYVSRYCHLTGALGIALTLSDQGKSETQFRGIDLHKKEIKVETEVCELCTNHCKITVANVDGEKVAYGFLCGRDYDTDRYVNNNISGFDLLKERKKILSFERPGDYSEDFIIGIPAALHIHEDIPFWKKFFDALSIKTVTSEEYGAAIETGKHMAGAEFCAPMAALHGHVNHLMKKSDYVFLPTYLERRVKGKNLKRQYCYYTQFSHALAPSMGEEKDGDRVLTPLVHYLYGPLRIKMELYRMLRSITKSKITFHQVSSAYGKACEFKRSSLLRLKEIYERESQKADHIHVVLLGRPYTVLSRFMNKGIPEIFASLGIRVFFQDMLPSKRRNIRPVKRLLEEIHWHYASEIIKATQVIAQTEGAYPVFLTSFKCSPDSFIIDDMKKIMESYEKPYLILQLDEHDSSLGYETRIEAAIRTFQNHHSSKTGKRSIKFAPSLLPIREKKVWDKTIILPNWDNITLRFIVANLRREGIDARCMEESEASIQKSLRHNTGQCIPLNIIAQEFMDYMESYNLDPAETLLWMVDSKIACNVGLFPHRLRSIIHSSGNGLERAGVYVGALSFADISMRLSVNTYFAYMFGGFLRKMGCRIRPYELNRGETDRVISDSIHIMEEAFLGIRTKEEALAQVTSSFEEIQISNEKRPKVAIFGDLYARDNEVMNQDLIHFIEENGGEVIVTPYSSYIKMIAGAYLRKWFIEGRYLEVLSLKALLTTITRLEKRYHKYLGRILENPVPKYDEHPKRILPKFNVRIENTGESMDNILKIFYIMKHYPDVSLFVQTSPAFCCPSIITEAMSEVIEKNTGVPIVSITYDGTASNKNEAIIPYLRYPRNTTSKPDVQTFLS